MDVGRATANGIEHHLVDEAHDRGVFDIVTRDLVVKVILAGRNLEAFQVDIGIIRQRRHLVVDLLECLVEGLLELVVLDDDRLDAEARAEPDFVDRM